MPQQSNTRPPDTGIDILAPDLARLRIAFVNAYFVGAPGGATPWVLVDAGLAIGAASILAAAAERFGVAARPAGIVLTHGHFDHVGGLEALLAVWDVPVYAHTAELPFLTGRADYPPPDPTVGEALIGRLVPVAPERGTDLGERIEPLPANGDVPGMPGWRWIPTPGHSPGHVSLFRPSDRALLAGDAVSTMRQESAYAVLAQPFDSPSPGQGSPFDSTTAAASLPPPPAQDGHELSGPPAYFTIDWDKAERSVRRLASLNPALLAAGHGPPIQHPSLASELDALARDFDYRIRPSHGRYVTNPALTDDEGIVTHAPMSRGVRWGTLSGVAAAAFAGTWLYRRFGRR